MPLQFYTSNRMELLVEYLSHVLNEDKLPPLDSEIIIVQSQGLARFLSMELAQRQGIWAGGEFLFPNAFLGKLFDLVLDGESGTEAWQRGPLAWRIYGLLPSLLSQPGFEVLGAYCRTPEKTFQLSQQISDLFDQYVLYRPEMISQWSRGEDDLWQAVLWRKLHKDIATPHRADLFAAVLKELCSNAVPDLPKRISLFGLSSMPPLMLDVFAALGEQTNVHVFFLNPCQQEWSQIMTRSMITRVELATGQGQEEQFLENGNELLASMGHLGRDYFDLLLERNPVIHPMFVEAPGSSLLASIQNEILDLQSVNTEQSLDDSLHFVSCHSGMREVEVLFDHLLHLFNAQDDLTPRDILVMAPDISSYAPLIDAVFRASGYGLSYAIADQSMQDQECFAGFSLLCKVAKGRWRVTEIMSLLEIPVLCRRFGLDDAELDQIRNWLAEVHVHWGRDQHHRAELGLPPSPEHSFRQGINRLLLGFAMDGDELFMGILPFKGDEFSGDVADKFLLFYEQLLRFASFFETAKPVTDWSRGLLDVVSDFFAPTSEQEWEVGQLRTILAGLALDADLGGYGQEVSPEIIQVWLKKALDLELSPYGFLSGGITFCSLLPMRAIPAKVVCLLGMNEADFPRSQIRPGFDLTARDYRKGDRLKRNDDRYLFLEALLSARKQLYISFIGRSALDNREILPSVLVSELLEYIQPLAGKGEQLVVDHPLQPFNPDYFNGVLPRSFSAENKKSCAALMARSRTAPSFLAELNIQSSGTDDVVDFADLLRFWQNPSAFFCARTLGLCWQSFESPLVDEEPFSLSGLDRYKVASDCIDFLLDDQRPLSLQKMQATGFLPQGIPGEMAFAEVASGCEDLVETVQSKTADPCENIQTILRCGAYRLDIKLGNLYGAGQVLKRVGGKIDGRHLIRAWLKHLVLQELDVSCEKTTFLIGTGELVTFPPLDNADVLLPVLLDYYQQGLSRPLPFFARSAWQYVQTAVKKGDLAGLKKARDTFNPLFQRFSPESAQPAIQRCFADYTLDAAFVEMARSVFEPLRAVAELDLVSE